MQMVDDNIGNKVRQNAVQNDGNEYGNGNVVTAPAKGNGNDINATLRLEGGRSRESKALMRNVCVHGTDAVYEETGESKVNAFRGYFSSQAPHQELGLTMLPSCLQMVSTRWIPTGRIFAMCGKLTASSNTENKSEKSMYDNASTSNPSEPSSKGFPISTSLLGRLSRLRKQHTSIYPIVVL
ncbi:hypothetical protein Tco_0907924 [Tanacetum coccineum]|uniref:Uncharacterized protein n=1 Tax=Tanacetum coccineum TaxID=301880 RepID=A0ABQ5CLT5_9ASTR